VAGVGIQPAILVESGVESDDLVPVGNQSGDEHTTDVTINTGDEYPHLKPLEFM
jgi:hypothetical protein